MINILFLAAGTSGRILEISKGKPKPLIQIKKKTILSRNFNWAFKSKLFKRYFINTYFKSNLIKKEIRKIKMNLKIKVNISNEKNYLGLLVQLKNYKKIRRIIFCNL